MLRSLGKSRKTQGPLNGGVSNGGGFRSGLVLPFLSFLSFLGHTKAFSPKKGLVFAVNGASPPPAPTPSPSPPPPPFLLGGGVLLKIPGGGGLPGRGGGGRGGQGRVRGIWGGGGWQGPIYRENEPLFRRKRLTFPIFPGFSRFVWGLFGDFPDLSFSSFSAY